MERISTGCKGIDDLLGGGVEKGCITEIYGEGGSGKTNLCLQMAINVAKSGQLVIYVDSEGVSMERFRQLGGNEEIAKKILFYHIYKFSQQADVIERIVKLVEKKGNIPLIIIDSLTEYYRAERGVGEDISSQKSLAWQLGVLNALARKKNIAVVVTNQIYMDSTTGDLKPIGGYTLQHNAKTIVNIVKVGDGLRKAILVKHRSREEGRSVKFRISQNGLSGDGV